MPRLLAAFPAVAGLQQIVDRIGGGVDVYFVLCVSAIWRVRHRVAGKSARRALLPPSAHGHQPVSVRAQSAPDAKVALDIPLFVARLSAKHFN